VVEYRLLRDPRWNRGGQHVGTEPRWVVASDPATGCCHLVRADRSQMEARQVAKRRLGELTAFVELVREMRVLCANKTPNKTHKER